MYFTQCEFENCTALKQLDVTRLMPPTDWFIVRFYFPFPFSNGISTIRKSTVIKLAIFYNIETLQKIIPAVVILPLLKKMASDRI